MSVLKPTQRRRSSYDDVRLAWATAVVAGFTIVATLGMFASGLMRG